MKHKRKYRHWLGFTLLAILLVDLCAFFYVYIKSEKFEISVPMKEKPYDAIIIFYGGKSDNKKRLEEGLNIKKKFKVKKIAFIGGCRPEREFFGSRNLANQAINLGVDEQDIVLGGGSHDTISNVESIAELAKDNNWSSLVFVSDKLHLARIKKLAVQRVLLSDIHIDFVASDYKNLLHKLVRVQYEVLALALKGILGENVFRRFVALLRLRSVNNSSIHNCINSHI